MQLKDPCRYEPESKYMYSADLKPHWRYVLQYTFSSMLCCRQWYKIHKNKNLIAWPAVRTKQHELSLRKKWFNNETSQKNEKTRTKKKCDDSKATRAMILRLKNWTEQPLHIQGSSDIGCRKCLADKNRRRNIHLKLLLALQNFTIPIVQEMSEWVRGIQEQWVWEVKSQEPKESVAERGGQEQVWGTARKGDMSTPEAGDASQVTLKDPTQTKGQGATANKIVQSA